MSRVIGVIGGTGSGKSYIAKLLAEKLNGLHIDCDKVANVIINTNDNCRAELMNTFGNDVIEGGTVNRKVLAERAFATAENTQALNQITHKYILEGLNEIIKNNENLSPQRTLIFDGATIVESGFNKYCDTIIAVISDKKKRIQRVMLRDNISLSEIEQRINAQKDDDYYINNADVVIYNNDGMNLREQLSTIN